MKPLCSTREVFPVLQSMDAPQSSPEMDAPQSSAENKRSRCSAKRQIRAIGIALVILMILLGLCMIISWLILMPKKIIFTVENGHVSNHTITDTRINGNFELQIKCFNPNRKASIYYQCLKVEAIYLNQKVSVPPIKPFSLPPMSETNLDIRFEKEFVFPFPNMKRSIVRDGIKLSLRMRAKTKFKLSKWTAKGRVMEIFCPSIVEYIHSTRHFERAPCVIDL